jgi:hypothetical protein
MHDGIVAEEVLHDYSEMKEKFIHSILERSTPAILPDLEHRDEETLSNALLLLFSPIRGGISEMTAALLQLCWHGVREWPWDKCDYCLLSRLSPA